MTSENSMISAAFSFALFWFLISMMILRYCQAHHTINSISSPISSITRYLLLLADIQIMVKYSMIQPDATQKSNRLDHVLKYFPHPVSLILNTMSIAIMMLINNSNMIKNVFSFHALESATVHRTIIVHATARAR